MAIRALSAALLAVVLCAGCTEGRERPFLQARANPFHEEAPPCCGACQDDQLYTHCAPPFPY